MEIEKVERIVKLSIRSDLTTKDLTEAEIKLAHSGIEGQKAFQIMRTLSAAVQGLDDSIRLFKFTLCNEPGTPKLLCTLELTSAPWQLTVSPETPIREALNLSVRARKGLVRLGIETVGQLVETTSDHLLSKSKNFGVTSLEEVRGQLAKIGGKLKGD